MLLADFVQVAEGKLSVLGGGWTFKGHGTKGDKTAAVAK